MNLAELKKELLKDKKFRREYEKHDLAFEIGQLLMRARIKKGWTQARLAEHAGKQQSAIARVENGHMPSLRFLEDLATAFGTHLVPPTFAFLVETKNETKTITPFRGNNQMQQCVWKMVDSITSTTTHSR